MGAGLPIYNLVTMSASEGELTKEGITSWDRETGFVVLHKKIGWIRLTIAVFFTIIFVALYVVGIVMHTRNIRG